MIALIIYLSFSYLFALGAITKLLTNGDEINPFAMMVAFILAPIVLPFRLGQKINE